MSFHLALPLSTNASMTEFICPSTVKNSPVSKSLGAFASPPHSDIFQARESSESQMAPVPPPAPSNQSCRSQVFIYLHPPPPKVRSRRGELWWEEAGEHSIIWRLNSHQDPPKSYCSSLTADSPHLF